MKHARERCGYQDEEVFRKYLPEWNHQLLDKFGMNIIEMDVHYRGEEFFQGFEIEISRRSEVLGSLGRNDSWEFCRDIG